MKKYSDLLAEFMKECYEEIQSGRASPFSRLEVITLGIFARWLDERESNKSGEVDEKLI